LRNCSVLVKKGLYLFARRSLLTAEDPTTVFCERHVRYMLSPVRSSVCLSSVGNARAPYSGGGNFKQYFYGIWYLGHPLTSTENFMKIVPGEPLHQGVKHKRGSKI